MCAAHDGQGVQEWAINALETRVAQHPQASLFAHTTQDTPLTQSSPDAQPATSTKKSTTHKTVRKHPQTQT